MIIISGSSSRCLSEDLAHELDAEVVHASIKRFPDDECYVRIERDSLDREAVIVQNSYPDRAIIELFLLQDAAMGLGVEKLIAVIPYFGYARQDKRFNPGEAVSARVMAQHIQLNSSMVITVDIHTPSILEWFDRAEAIEVSAATSIGKYFTGWGIDTVLAPDKGAAGRAEKVASIIGAEWDHLVKTRISGREVKVAPKKLDVSGKKVLIVDDIISTGGTIMAATSQLKQNGAEEVIAACTHGLFVGGALEKLKEVCDEVISTNTIESEVSKISVAPQVAEILKDFTGKNL